MFIAHPHEFQPVLRAAAADLRLRGHHHRRARQPVGNAGRRNSPRAGASHRRANQCRAALHRRSRRLSCRSAPAAARPVPQGVACDASARTRICQVCRSRIPHGEPHRRRVLVAPRRRLVAAPYWSDRQTMRLLTEIYSFVALASLWNLLAGYAGLVSVGQQAFVGLGGYTLYLCALWLGLNPMLGLPLAGVVGGLVAIPRGAAAEAARRLFHHRLVGDRRSVPADLPAGAGGRRRVGHQPSGDRWSAIAKPAAARVDDLLDLSRARGRGHRRDHRAVALALRPRVASHPRQREAAKSNGIDVNRARMVVFVVAASRRRWSAR